MITLRRRARQFVIQALYQAELNQDETAQQVAQNIRESINKPYAEKLDKLQHHLDDTLARAKPPLTTEQQQRLQQSFDKKQQKLAEERNAIDELFTQIFFGAYNNRQDYMKNIRPLLDRHENELNPVEHAVLLMASHELAAMPETPYPVIINEAIEITKTFGGTEGYKFVNGILDKLVAQWRPHDAPRT